MNDQPVRAYTLKEAGGAFYLYNAGVLDAPNGVKPANLFDREACWALVARLNHREDRYEITDELLKDAQSKVSTVASSEVRRLVFLHSYSMHLRFLGW